jgi:GNAT superfamily N-acetyltransferase
LRNRPSTRSKRRRLKTVEIRYHVGMLIMERNDIANYSVKERLRDGRTVTIRAIRPDDKGRMADTLRQVSPESLYRRTFSAKRDLSSEELKNLTEVDFVNIVALVAFIKTEEHDRIAGGGRYIRTGESDAALKAEVAFLIDDVYQGLGIGSRIFKHLVRIARASGITQFEAEVLPANDGMLRLFARSGLPVVSTPSRDSVHVTIDLNPDEKLA